MLPEGAHLFHSDWTIFFLRQTDVEAKPSEEAKRLENWKTSQQEQKKQVEEFNPSCDSFRYLKDEWMPETGRQSCRIVCERPWQKDLITPPARLEVYEEKNNEVLYTAKVNQDMTFTVLSEEENFVSFYPEEGEAVGLRFEKKDDFNELSELVRELLAPEPRPPDPE